MRCGKRIIINLLLVIIIILSVTLIILLFIWKKVSLQPHNGIKWSLIEEYYSLYNESYAYNERVIKKIRWNEEIYGWWDLRFIKRTDSNWWVYYLADAWGFLEIASSIIYNPLNADISQECTMKEVRTCDCYKEIWWCEVQWHY